MNGRNLTSVPNQWHPVQQVYFRHRRDKQIQAPLKNFPLIIDEIWLKFVEQNSLEFRQLWLLDQPTASFVRTFREC